jgi:hypothetical protein
MRERGAGLGSWGVEDVVLEPPWGNPGAPAPLPAPCRAPELPLDRGARGMGVSLDSRGPAIERKGPDDVVVLVPLESAAGPREPPRRPLEPHEKLRGLEVERLVQGFLGAAARSSREGEDSLSIPFRLE